MNTDPRTYLEARSSEITDEFAAVNAKLESAEKRKNSHNPFKRFSAYISVRGLQRARADLYEESDGIDVAMLHQRKAN